MSSTFLGGDSFSLFSGGGSGSGGGISGTGTTNRVAKFTAASVIGNSNITDTGSLITLGSNTYVSGSLGINTATPGAPLDIHATGTNAQFNGTGTNNAYLQFQNAGASKWRIGNTYNAGANSFDIYNNGLTNTALSFNSSTNAATFNNSVTATSLIKSGGTSSQYLMADGSVSTLTNPVTGTGTTNTLPKFTGTSAIGNSNITDSGTLISLGSDTNISSGALGIGTSTLTGYSLNVAKNITGATTSYGIRSQGTVQSDVTTLVSNYGSLLNTAAASFTLTDFVHHRSMQGTIGAGSVVTNQYGYYADSSMTGATNNYGFYGNIASGTNRWNLYMNGTANNYMNGSLGIGTSTLTGYSLNVAKNITGATTSYGIRSQGTVQSDVTTLVSNYGSLLNTAAASFTLTDFVHHRSMQGTIGAGSVVTNQYGYYADSSMTGATNNYGFYSGIASGTNRWNLYMQGTAANYLAGVLNIGSTSLAGFQLDVNGTARVQGQTIITSAATGITPIIRVTNTSSGNFTFMINNSGTGNANFGFEIDSVRKATIGYSRSGNYLGLFHELASVDYFIIQLNSDGSFSHHKTSDGVVDFKIFNGGNTIIGASTINASAQLQVDSTTKGFLPPVMTTTQKNAITSPATGLIVFDSTLGKLCVFSTTWQTITST